MSQKFRSWQRPPMGYDENWATWVTSVLNSLTTPSPPGSTLLNVQSVKAAIVGNGAAQNLYTFVLPPNTLAIGKALRVKLWFSHSTGAGNVTYQLVFGATAVGNLTGVATQFNGHWEMIVQATGVAAENAVTSALTVSNTIGGGAQQAAPAENLAGAILIKATFNAANTEQVTPLLFIGSISCLRRMGRSTRACVISSAIPN